MSFSRRSAVGSFALAAILTSGGSLCLAASPSDDAAISNEQEHERRFTIQAGISPAREHASSLRLLTGYDADPGECGDELLGPLPEGKYTGKEAWLKLIEPVCSLVNRPDEKSGGTTVFADMGACKCSFGLPRLTRVQQGHMLVTGSWLPGLDEYIASPVLVMGRKRIDETRAASIPDLLRYISQSAFHRGRGFRPSGAQYAELRGLGAGYTLVLLNGRRTSGTAADLATGAFDLSNIPISAVERVEISMDANSLVHGMDAIGGIVNVVLKDSVEPVIELRYGSASAGATQSQASVSGGMRGESGRVAVFLDVQRSGELLGHERDRWNNQDFTRFGGLDARTPLGSPPTVSSVDGQNLPGLDAPYAAAQLNPETGRFDYVAGERNSTSLRAFQAIVPQGQKAALAANGSFNVGASVASVELLAVRRENELQIMPSFVPGYTWGANHPENPFGVPVNVEAVLAGLPAQRQSYQTDSRRAVAAIKGRLGDGKYGPWDYSAFAVRSDEDAKAHLLNATDPAVISKGLQGDDTSQVLSLYSTMRQTTIPAGLFVDSPVDRYHAGATHLQASVQGPLLRMPAGGLTAKFGMERRQESMDWHQSAGGARIDIDGVNRDITSMFTHLLVPLIDATMNVPAVADLKLLLGARRDDYSDIGAVTKKQLGLIWRITESLKLQAATSESFRPPSLVDLYFPRLEVPAEFYDPRRRQAGPVELITGGNPDLQATTGRSNSIGISFQPRDGVLLSADYWRVKVRNHIALSTPMSLLAHEDSTLPGRIVRAPRSSADEMLGQPGRLLLLDISRGNVGGAAIEGVDLAAERVFETYIGSFTPRVSVTLTEKFEYSELPVTQVRMEDRLGVASEFGTIPAQRGVASLTYESDEWRASVHAHVVSSYWDRDELTGEPMQHRVSGGAIYDLNVARKIAGNLRLTLGAFNVTSREPPYAHAGGSLGFDTSQGDLEGREIYVTLSGTF